MANELIRMKSGLIKNIEKNETTGQSPVNIQAGTIYFAVDDNKETGKILYDVDSTHRIVMSTQAEYADYAGEAAKTTGISGIYPVKGTQTASTASWTGTIFGVNELTDGLTIAYYLPYAGTSTSATLNLTFENGATTGAIPVYYTGTNRATTHLGAGSTIILTYWSAGSISVGGTATTQDRWTRADYDSTNIYQLKINYGNFKPITALYRYQFLLTKNETDLIPINAVNNSTATNKTLTTEEFNPFGQIYYWNATSTISANTGIGDWTYLYIQTLADLRYSFNTGTTLTTNKAVYLVAIPQSNNMAKLDANPIVQNLPTSADGKIYIYLGQMNSTSHIELVATHPIYYYKGGKIALYTGEPEASSNNSGLMSAVQATKLDGIANGATNTTIAATAPINASAATGNVTLTHSTSGPSTTASTSKGDTSNQTPAFGGTFKVTSETVDKFGHTTALAEHIVKIPNTEADTSHNGLMTIAQVTKLEGIEAGAQVNTVTGVKGNSESSYRTGNVNITKANIGLGNVENKSSATIRGELTSANVTTALGYTPATQDVATTGADGLMSSSDKIKLNGIAEGAEVNQNAFAKVKVGSTTVEADAKQDVLELVGSNVTLTPDATNDKVTIGITKTNVTTALGYTPPTTNTTYNNATTSVAGLMSAEDKAKLDGIAENAKNTTISATNPIIASASTGAVALSHATSGPSTTADTSKGDTSNQTPTWGGTFKVTSGTVDKFGHTKTFADHTVKIPNAVATSGAAGLMSASDKANFDNGITIANNTIAIGSSLGADTLRTSLGLSNAMHFIGHATVAITDNSTTDPEILNYNFGVNGTNAQPGDVIIDKDTSYEYVWSTLGRWERLGPDGSYALSNHTHSNATSNAAGFMSASDKAKLDGMAVSSISGTAPIGASTTSGVTTITHATSGPSTSGDTSKGDTSNQTPGFGGTFKVTSGTVNKFGHTTTFAEHTVTIPATEASTSNKGLMTTTQVSKLNGIAANAQVNVLENVKMNGTALTISSKAVNIPLMGAASADAAGTVGVVPAPGAGKQLSFLRGDGTWVVPTNTTYSNATAETAGLMSANDKAKLDGIAAGAKTGTVTSVATGAGLKGGTITISGTLKANLRSETKLTNDSAAATETAGRIYPVALDKTGYLAVNVPWTNTTYNNATTSTAGLMSSDDKTKLDGIQSGATAVSFSRNLTSGTKIGTITINGTATDLYSTNNTWTAFKGATASAAGTAGYINAVPAAGNTGSYFGSDGAWHGEATTSNNGLMTADMVTKLAGITSGATNTTISATSPIVASASTGAVSITHANSGVTANTYGVTATTALTPGFGSTFSVPGFTVNAMGHVTAAGAHTVKIPATTASTSAAGLMSKDDKAKLDGIAEGAKTGTVTSVGTGAGLTGGSITTSGTIKANLKSETKLDIDAIAAVTAGTTDRVYPILLDKTGYLAVNVPWVNTTYNNATTSTAGLMSANDKTKLDSISSNAAIASVSGTAPISASTTNGAVTITHATSGPSTTADTAKGDTTNQTPGWGSTFKVTSGTVDKYGHTKTFADHTVTIPSAVATTGAAGLMSANDKSKLDGIAAGAKTGTVTSVMPGSGLASADDKADSDTKTAITTSGTLYLTKSGVTAGTYGPAAATTSATGSSAVSVNIPYITVDKYGRVTSISNRTFSSSDNNTDTKVTNTLGTTTKYYVTGTTSTTTNTGTQTFDTGVYVTTTAGELNAKQYKVDEAVTLQYNTTTKSLDFIFA